MSPSFPVFFGKKQGFNGGKRPFPVIYRLFSPPFFPAPIIFEEDFSLNKTLFNFFLFCYIYDIPGNCDCLFLLYYRNFVNFYPYFGIITTIKLQPVGGFTSSRGDRSLSVLSSPLALIGLSVR